MTAPRSGALALAHLVGDFVLQTHHQATEKTSRWVPALLHAATYTAAHLPVTRDPRALATIGLTHAVIDRYRLAKYLVWAKNQAAPAAHRVPLADLRQTGTGYPASTPAWLATWLLILTDNTIHLAINAAAVRRWAR